MRGLFIGLAISAVAGPAVAAAACGDVLRLDKAPAIKVEDVARLGAEEFKDAGGDYYLSVAPFRSAERPERDGWRALAIIKAGERGLSVEDLGGILWTKRPDQFGDKPLRLEATATKARATTMPRAPLAGCPKGFSIEIDSEGFVMIDGAKWKRVGGPW